jgi:poly-gamma-glutamate synthesis protein (capsule biosynthesis protein)
MSKNTLVLYGVGDVSPIHEPIDAYSSLIRPVLKQADIRFCAAERPYSDRGTPQLNSGVSGNPVPPRLASVFTDCGFDVVSIASNHMLDWGPEAMLNTRDNLRGRGIKVIGAGENLEEACSPALVDKNGVRVAFLSFCSVIREGWDAGPNRPGIAPMRAKTYFEHSSYQPGVPPRIVTIPDAGDLENMVRHIRAAKEIADVVVLSMHWGVAFVPRLIADYQSIVAKAAAAAGANIILGHHTHVPKAIGVYGDTACFYSLGNFIITSNYLGGDPKKIAAFEREMGVTIDPDYPRLPFGSHAKHSLIAKAVLSKTGVDQVSFLPMLLDKQIRPEIFPRSDPRFEENLRFMEWVSDGFPHTFTVSGDEVVVTAAG